MIHPKSSKQRETFIKNKLSAVINKQQFQSVKKGCCFFFLFSSSVFSYPEYGKSESTLQREVTLHEEKLCL